MESWVQRWRPRTNAFCDFSTPPVKSTAPATKNWCQVIRSAAPVTQNHLSKPTDLMLQNATPLRKSAPWPPNISDEHVFCTAPATRNASLQILFKCPTLAIVFGNATKPSRFAHFWEGAQSLAPATRNDILTSKSGPEPPVFLTFRLRNVLRATTACTFFDISTSKSGPRMVCFVHFDLEMCFAPQRRALFRHLNFQKWSENGVFCTFWLRHVLRTQSFISHLARWLRTRRFSEPTSRPSGASKHWKNTVRRDFPGFSRTYIFFLLTLSLLWSSLFYSSLLSDSLHLFPPHL